ncbi:translation initiation factor IF-2 N-terminal domain-containing protein [Gordonia paraffinivorans]|uniref:translation initiation factor IF-2 N-terminal domain-containing protein n=1 Tax=Gordonia paraffinivorans TaxID=175628 RepID=UPI0014456213|nr:translation initiation factor IF-2 N-terminal domain-containing protein [Gordonia paraffinivorans]
MTDNGSPADANAASEPVEEFPSKLRVHALARFLGLTSRQVLAHLATLGVQTRSPQSSVDRELAQAVAERVRANIPAEEVATAEPAAETAPAEEQAAEAATAPEPEAPSAEPAAEEPAAEQAPAEEAADTAAEESAEAADAASAGKDASDEAEPEQGPAGEPTPADEPLSLFSAASTQYHEPIVTAPVPTNTPFDVAPLFLPPQPPAPGDEVDEDTADEVGGEAAAGRVTAEQSSTDTPDVETTDTGTGTTDTGTGTTDAETTDTETTGTGTGEDKDSESDNDSDDSGSGSGRSRRRRRGRRGRGRGRGDQGADAENNDDSTSGDSTNGDSNNGDSSDSDDSDDAAGESADESAGESATGSEDSDSGEGAPTGRRRRRSRRSSSASQGGESDTDESSESQDKESGDSETASKDAKKGNQDKTGDKNAQDKDGGAEDDSEGAESDDESGSDSEGSDSGEVSSTRRRRRRRRRKGVSEPDEGSPDDPPNTVVHEREPRSKRARDEVQGISGSTRLEAKRQRRRDGRDAGRRRPPILTESEFLARREAVDRVMVVRERSANSRIVDADDHQPVEDYTQVAVLEDGVLVEHFVTTANSASMVGNIYLGRVQNVLPGMEAAFVDIGRGRNGVLYAGEVNWDAAGLDGGSRKIEQALKPGDNVLVQVSKDPVGHKGARLTTQISLAGRYLVYVPGGSSTGISRKLPDVERKRLKQILAKLVPDDAGVIIRTASEGVSAEELGADIARLEAQWKSIEEAVETAKKSGSTAPKALYEEPDLLVRVVRDLFNEDFKKLVVEGDNAWNLVEGYISSVAPDLMERVEKFSKPHADAPDSFAVHRIDEQLAKALDRKVWLPSGGTLIIEHTEAMTVIDVNTGKFTGSGGNLEETVTRNNLEAAEEIVRQMRLRDIGGMIIVDFIDMVLESNRDLVLRRLTEALARDRTRHQVSEVTSLGLVQMTRKRLGTGLLEAFSTTCTACGGRGLIVHQNPVEVRPDDSARAEGGSKRSRRGKKKSEPAAPEAKPAALPPHKPAAEHPLFRAMAAHHHDEDHEGEHVEEAHVRADEVQVEESSAAEERAVAEAGETRAEKRAAGPKGDETRAAETTAAETKTAETKTAETKVDEAKVDEDGAATAEGDESESEKAEGEKAEGEQSEGEQSEGTAAEADEAADSTPVVEQEPESQAAREPAGEAPETGDKPAATTRRRRRAVRRPVQTTTAPENVVMTASDAAPAPEPTTTFGPISSDPAEPVVAVRRRPRRRTAGRPAGPPPADD